jgi:hypothetical protein
VRVRPRQARAGPWANDLASEAVALPDAYILRVFVAVHPSVATKNKARPPDLISLSHGGIRLRKAMRSAKKVTSWRNPGFFVFSQLRLLPLLGASAKPVPHVLNEKMSWFEFSIRRRRAQSSPTPQREPMPLGVLLFNLHATV